MTSKADETANGLKPCSRCQGSGWVIDPIFQGHAMRQLRLRQKVTLRTVASRMGFSPAYVSDLELGRRNWNDGLMVAYEQALHGKRRKL